MAHHYGSKTNLQVAISFFDLLKIEILFYRMTNMMIIFQIMIIMLKNLIFESRFLLNVSTCTGCPIFQMGYK
jgi:hypothetical protein